MGFLKGVLLLIFAAAAVGFAVHNDSPASLKYYFGWETILLPIYLWAFLSFFLGLIVSGVVTAFSRIALHSRIRQQSKAIVELERKRTELKLGRRPS